MARRLAFAVMPSTPSNIYDPRSEVMATKSSPPPVAMSSPSPVPGVTPSNSDRSAQEGNKVSPAREWQMERINLVSDR